LKTKPVAIPVFFTAIITLVFFQWKDLSGEEKNSSPYTLLFQGKGDKLFAYTEKGEQEIARLAEVHKNTDLKRFHQFNGRYYFSIDGEPILEIDYQKLLSDHPEAAIRTLPSGHRKQLTFDNSYRKIVDFSLQGVIAQKREILVSDRDKINTINLSGSRWWEYSALFRKGSTLYIGTSVKGLYKIENFTSGEKKRVTPVPLSNGLPFIPYDNERKIYEEIRSIHVTDNGTILVGTGFGGGLYIYTDKEKSFKKVTLPAQVDNSIFDIDHISVADNQFWLSTTGFLIQCRLNDTQPASPAECYHAVSWDAIVDTKTRFAVISSADNRLLTGVYTNREKEATVEKKKRLAKAANRHLFYSSPYQLEKKIDAIERLLDSASYNGMVIDVKDDNGYIRYNSNIPFLKEIGAVKPLFDLKKIVDLVHKKNGYLVVRVVVFKDPVLFQQKGFAILDKTTGEPWGGSPVERWIDPFNKELPKLYYIPLVKELEALGVDEIQLDYIRFPSDGKIYNCSFAHRDKGQYYEEGLEEFLYQVGNATSLPVGIDIYGYNGIYRSAGVIGQDMERFIDHIDVVSPMLYSSHFGDSYLTDRPIEQRITKLISHSVSRSVFIGHGQVVLRPYLQAFPMKNKIWGYGEQYFKDQVESSKTSGGDGFSFWGAIDHMAAVEKALR